MQQSTVYKELEAMIAKGVFVETPSELDQLLKKLMQDGQITTADYRSLLEMYVGKFKKTQ